MASTGWIGAWGAAPILSCAPPDTIHIQGHTSGQINNRFFLLHSSGAFSTASVDKNKRGFYKLPARTKGMILGFISGNKGRSLGGTRRSRPNHCPWQDVSGGFHPFHQSYPTVLLCFHTGEPASAHQPMFGQVPVPWPNGTDRWLRQISAAADPLQYASPPDLWRSCSSPSIDGPALSFALSRKRL